MTSKVIIVGEVHQDLFYSTDFFTRLSKDITEGIITFLKENQKTLLQIDSDILEKKVLKLIDDSPKKIGGNTFIKRGGNGNNSAMLLNNLSIPVQLMSTIGSGHEWILEEMEKIGIENRTIYKVEDKGPISTIIEDPNITKIFIAPNLKENMNFEKVKIEDSEFDDAKIVFFTPLAEKYSALLEKVSKLPVITAVTIEIQKIQNEAQLKQFYRAKSDILFANLNDLAMILNINTSETDEKAISRRLEQVDEKFKEYADIRIYTLGKYGSWICIDELEMINIPIIPVEVKNRTGAGDTYAAGFIAYLFDNIDCKDKFGQLAKQEKIYLLKECGLYARAAAALKIKTGESPNKTILEEFYNENL